MVSSGLRYIHALGVVHRDIKPENLLYYHPGHDSRLIISDFGLACWSSRSHAVGSSDAAAGGSCGARRAREILDCAGSDVEDNRGTGGARSCGVINIKGKDTVADCRRLADDGKARESRQGRGVTIGGDECGDANGFPVSTGDEREIDESLGFDGTGTDSRGVENKGGCSAALSGGLKKDRLHESQTDGSGTYKHTNLNMEGKREDRAHQERQHQFSNNNLDSRQTNCAESSQGGPHISQDKNLHNITAASTVASGGPKGHDWALRTLCGTPEYLAPEMVAGTPYGSAVDVWALGVISYILLSGSMPFDQQSKPRLFKAILKGRYSFHGEVSVLIF